MPEYVTGANTKINKALLYATEMHGDQVRKGGMRMPYIFHPIEVATELSDYSGLGEKERELATIVCLLHDVLEDTSATYQEIKARFGSVVADAVAALSKDTSIADDGTSKEDQIRENLDRLLEQPCWVQCVKLADRSTNLKRFPKGWDRKKIGAYLDESELIAETLKEASQGLHARLISNLLNMRLTFALLSAE